MARRTLYALIASLTVLTVGGVTLARPHDDAISVRLATFGDEPEVTTTTVGPTTTVAPTTTVPATTSTTAPPASTTTSTSVAPSTTSTTEKEPASTTTTEKKPAATTTTEKPKPKPTTTEKPKIVEKPTVQTAASLRLACKRIDDTHLGCHWGDVPDGTTRIALMRQGGGVEGRTVYMTTDPAARSAVDASVVAGETYMYQVAAGNDQAKLAVSNQLKVPPTGEEVSTDKPAIDPKSSIEISCKQTGDLLVSCKWGAVPDATTKVALMRERPGTPSQAVFMTEDTTKHYANDANVDAGVTYIYRVMAGNSKGIIAGSPPVKITIGGDDGDDGESEGVEMKVVCGQISVESRPALVCEWYDPEVTVAKYRVFKRPSGDGPYQQVGAVEVRRIVDKNVTSGAFDYLVQGLDASGKVVALGETSAKCCTPAGDGR